MTIIIILRSQTVRMKVIPSLCPPLLPLAFFFLTSVWSSNQGSGRQGVQHGVIKRCPGPRRGQLGQLRCNIRRVWTRVSPTEGPRETVLVSAAHVQRVTVAGVPRRPVIHRRAWRVMVSTGSVRATGAV